MNKKVVLSLGALAVAGGLAYTASKVQAFGPGSGSNHQNMAATLAEKLGKSESEVESAFDSIQEEHRQQAQSAFENRLDAAVKNGQITVEQKQLILAKHQELQAQFEAEQQQREQHRQELQTWAEENKIDLSFLGQLGMGFGNGEGRGLGMGKMDR